MTTLDNMLDRYDEIETAMNAADNQPDGIPDDDMNSLGDEQSDLLHEIMETPPATGSQFRRKAMIGAGLDVTHVEFIQFLEGIVSDGGRLVRLNHLEMVAAINDERARLR